MSAVGFAGGASAPAFSNVTATKYNATLSWSSNEGLAYNGNSGGLAGARSRAVAGLAALTAPKVVEVMLILGSNDMVNSGTAGAFQTDTTNLLARMRADLPLTSVPIVQFRVPNTITDSPTIRTAQATIDTADSYFSVVDMDAQPKSGDNLHWKVGYTNNTGLTYGGSASYDRAAFA